MSPESLIFDIDGTLWDSRALVAKGYNQHLCEVGHPELQVDVEFLKTVFGKTMHEIADIMLSSIPVPERYEILDGCMRCEHLVLESDPCDMAFPGVVETLEALSKKYRLFIVSNSQCGYPELLMNKLSVGHLFQGHLCYGDTGTSKGQTIKTLMQISSPLSTSATLRAIWMPAGKQMCPSSSAPMDSAPRIPTMPKSTLSPNCLRFWTPWHNKINLRCRA